ncbi:MAG: hypothetical protein M3362_13250 [Acidobacteriota bacterium]|nr:hypothetical protein [Acidobacteriota bacterium]
MRQRTSPLDNVSVAAPCSVGWDSMVGTERVRFCGQCNLNVYNLSAMSKAEAEHLVAQTEGRLCVRYYRRGDGTILTKNCPVGLRAIKRRLSRVVAASASAAISFFAGIFAFTGLREPFFSPTATQGAIVNRLPEKRVVVGTLATPPEEIVAPKPIEIQGQVVVGRLKPVEHPKKR